MSRVLISFLTLILIIVQPALSKEDDKKARVDAMMENIGINLVFSSLKTSLSSIPFESVGTTEEERKRFDAAFESALEESFDSETMRLMVRDRFVAELTDEDLDNIIGFYSTTFGKRVLALENQAQKPEVMDAINGNIPAILKKLEQDPERKVILTSIIGGLSAIQQGEAIAVNIMYSMFAGMISSGQIPQALSDEEISSIIDQEKPKIREETTNITYASFYVIYEPLSIDELKRYQSVLLRKSSIRFYTIFLEAFSDAMGVESIKFGHKLLVLMGKRDA